MEHFEGHDLFHAGQFGFRPGKSTTLALISLIEKVTEGLEGGEMVGSLFCNLTKAFDCVPPGLLLDKLYHYNFGEKSIQLIRSYFSNRRQYVSLNSEKSGLEVVDCGVPQGSVLGPVLFLIFINDFGVGLGADRVLFADDTTLLLSGRGEGVVRERMERAQSEATTWIGENGLRLNEGKTQKMIFSTKPSSLSKEKTSSKFLGFYLDPSLSWEQHCNFLANKLSKNIFVIRTLKDQVPLDSLLLAYHALFMSHCAYGLLAWGHSPHAGKIFGLQRKVIRVIYNKPYREDVRDTFASNKLLTLPSLYILECLKYVKQNMHVYNMQGGAHSHNTRNRTDLEITFLRLSHSRFGPNYCGPKFYNALPSVVQRLPFGAYVSVIKEFLTRRALYNYNDFIEISREMSVNTL